MPPKQYVKIFDIYVCNQLHLPWLKCVCQQVVCCCGLHNFEGRKPLSAGTVSIVLEMGAQSHCRCENRKKADSDGKLVCSMFCCKDSHSVRRFFQDNFQSQNFETMAVQKLQLYNAQKLRNCGKDSYRVRCSNLFTYIDVN